VGLSHASRNPQISKTLKRATPHESQSISAADLRSAARRPHEVHMTTLTDFTSFPPNLTSWPGTTVICAQRRIASPTLVYLTQRLTANHIVLRGQGKITFVSRGGAGPKDVNLCCCTYSTCPASTGKARCNFVGRVFIWGKQVLEWQDP
jgi:hypothetical protein